ncbi:ATP-NAD kinase family protein [Paraglaciecola aquimarina]|uniref:ATP-NAD kinase family protein n=1 Tax=Paraglaciecola aquimarina TaxID=1235557 RepID=A0ABU3T0W1_9ALTE|nr:ATP-NAD kinase family protein [Paraglaciecola aquimarina]MDU0355880.1 ATP-NAD kinase family protein [Paraglaciecola aquimarina]
MFKLGLIINPYAGIGGALALKGSDGRDIRERAMALGAEKKALDKTRLGLQLILPIKHLVHFYIAAGEMGEDLIAQMGFDYTVVYHASKLQTESDDTESTAQALIEHSVDLVLFVGGDGTARNVCNIIAQSIPVLGIPAGCKIHSGVFAVTPQATGRVLEKVLKGEIVSVNTGDVMDIDEALFRQGKVSAKYYGEMHVPTELAYIQGVKMGGKESDELVLADIAAHVVELMEDNPTCLFVMGSGSTVDYVMQELQLENTLLGVDILLDQQLIAKDVTAEQLLQITRGQNCKLVITLIGGQGHILGRGNQQLSPEFLTALGKENIVLVATKSKLTGLQGRPLIVDSGDKIMDQNLAGLMTVVTGYRDQVLYPVADFT